MNDSESHDNASMLTTTTIHEAITARIINAIEQGQTPPPWRKPWRPDVENSGFPFNLLGKPFTGINALLLNMAAVAKGLNSRFWNTQSAWETFGGRVVGEGTLIFRNVDQCSLLTVFNADEVSGGEMDRFRSRRRPTAIPADYGPADELIAACRGKGAIICQGWEPKAEYHYPPADRIIFPFREVFLAGPGGLPGYYDSLFHELAGHWTEPRLGFQADYQTCEMRSEIDAPFLTSQLGIPVLCDMAKIRNHGKHLERWIAAMHADPNLIFNVAHSASQGVEYVLSLRDKTKPLSGVN